MLKDDFCQRPQARLAGHRVHQRKQTQHHHLGNNLSTVNQLSLRESGHFLAPLRNREYGINNKTPKGAISAGRSLLGGRLERTGSVLTSLATVNLFFLLG